MSEEIIGITSLVRLIVWRSSILQSLIMFCLSTPMDCACPNKKYDWEVTWSSSSTFYWAAGLVKIFVAFEEIRSLGRYEFAPSSYLSKSVPTPFWNKSGRSVDPIRLVSYGESLLYIPRKTIFKAFMFMTLITIVRLLSRSYRISSTPSLERGALGQSVEGGALLALVFLAFLK